MIGINPSRKLAVLLIDDDDVAAEGVTRSLKKAGVPCETTIAVNGADALDILRGTHPTKYVAAPYLVLLDLNMPLMNGFEFLENIRVDPTLKESVVFILTTSSQDIDRARSYAHNVAGYMVKSMVGPQFAQLCTLLDSYHKFILLPDLVLQ